MGGGGYERGKQICPLNPSPPFSPQPALPSTTDALLLVASRPATSGPPASLWALHAAALVAGSAGPSFLPQVQTTLKLCQELLVSRKPLHP